MKGEWQLFLAALQFLTRVPVPASFQWRPELLQPSARHFPAVGLVVGAVSTLALVVGTWGFAWPIGVALAIAASVLMTGAFHEDGLADTFDALGGSAERERALSIMKDSRIGSYGSLALLLVVGAKAAALLQLPLAAAAAALLFGHAASRAAAVALMRWLPYAGEPLQSKAKPLVGGVSATGLAVACGWVLVAALALSAWQPGAALPMLIAVLVAALTTVGLGRWYRRRLGGITGDTLGATQQLAELVILLAWVAAERWLPFL